MPKNPNRDYEKENAWAASPEQKHRRAQRNKARRLAERKGLVHKGDGLELDHLGMNRKGDLGAKVRVVPKKVNRAKQPKRSGKND
jgi:hypothetical protein